MTPSVMAAGASLVAHLGMLALMFACAAALGDLVLRRQTFDSPLERLVFTLALGLGLAAFGLFGLGLFGLLRREWIIGATIVGAILGTIVLARRYRRALAGSARRVTALPAAHLWATAAIGATGLAYWGLLLVQSQFPPQQWDALMLHLVIARTFLQQHAVVVVPDLAQPVMPALNHMLFAWALALQDDVLAQLVEHALMMLLALGLVAWGVRLKRPIVGLAAAVVWLAHPLVLWLGASAYVDVGLACYVFLGLSALRIWWDTRQASWWLLSLVLLAMAAGIKVPGLFFLGLAGALGVITRGRGLTPRRVVVGSMLAGVIVAPWYAFIWYQTGNPIWPMLPQWSRAGWGGPGAERAFAAWHAQGVPRTLMNFLRVPLTIWQTPERFHPDNGFAYWPVVLLWPLTWIASWWNRSVRWWSSWVLGYTIFWFLSGQYLRYWLPALPLAGLALCETLDWTLGRIPRVPRGVRPAIWAAFVLAALASGVWTARAEVLTRGTIPPARTDARERFLLEHVGDYRGVAYINQRAAPGDVTYVVDARYLRYYFHTRVIDAPANGPRVTLTWPEDATWVSWLKSVDVTWLLVDYTVSPKLIAKANAPPTWPEYPLIYADERVWVYRFAVVPPNARTAPTPDCSLAGGPSAPGGARDRPPVEGFLDRAECGTLMGWAWDPAAPNCALSVDLSDDDRVFATIGARDFRSDLLNAQKGSGFHGFATPFPDAIKDGSSHAIHARVAGTRVDLVGSPRTLTCGR